MVLMDVCSENIASLVAGGWKKGSLLNSLNGKSTVGFIERTGLFVLGAVPECPVVRCHVQVYKFGWE